VPERPPETTSSLNASSDWGDFQPDPCSLIPPEKWEKLNEVIGTEKNYMNGI
jgi:hypothetical protein